MNGGGVYKVLFKIKDLLIVDGYEENKFFFFLSVKDFGRLFIFRVFEDLGNF